MEDLQRPDGCFRGLRSYTENIFGAAHESKQVDAAAIINSYPHAKIPTAVLHWGEDSYYVPCPGNSRWPMGGAAVYSEWGLHWEDDYTDRLNHVTVGGVDYSNRDPFTKARVYVLLAFKSYDSTDNTKKAIAEKMPGWKLVAKETLVTGWGSTYDEDPVWLMQESSTLGCALVFTGTNNRGNEPTTSTISHPTGYCGFDKVHTGYRNELWHIAKNLWPNLRPKLAKCSKVDCVGHSLGGSVCEVFAACVNSKRVDDTDYQMLMWQPTSPEAMPELSGPDSIIRNEMSARLI